MRRPRTLAAILLGLITARFAEAQPAESVPLPTTARAAVEQAKNAFEYRDFERVVKLVYPWLHPRRILDRTLAIDARRLLGVSLHVLGRDDESREEFAELLLLDPRHKLDPFLVPPAVIQSFEDIRISMKPTLDQILLEQGLEPAKKPIPAGPLTVTPVAVPSLALAMLPVGIPQFAADEVGWGLLWAVLQVGFLSLNFVAFDQAGQNNGGSFNAWTALQFVGLGGFLVSWTVSGLQGYAQLEAAQRRTLREANDSLNRPNAVSSAVPNPKRGPSLVFGWEF